eukprot:gb/GECH01009066.1/.p1 GENE.gb/GECH01009066.1/~~gb/GECH01009066.1/.p1  ORF type:complete len:345 (+),score=64.45 gb/GECH01009066.1/:1-1035(+)
MGEKQYLESFSAINSWWGDKDGPAPPGYGTHLSVDRSNARPWKTTIPSFCDDNVGHQIHFQYMNLDVDDLSFSIDHSIMPAQDSVKVQLIDHDHLKIQEETVLKYDESEQEFTWKGIIRKLVSRFGIRVLSSRKVKMVVTPQNSLYSFGNLVKEILMSPTISITRTNRIPNTVYKSTQDYIPLYWNSTGYIPHVKVGLHQFLGNTSAGGWYAIEANKGEYRFPTQNLMTMLTYRIDICHTLFPDICDRYARFSVSMHDPPSPQSSSSSSSSSSNSKITSSSDHHNNNNSGDNSDDNSNDNSDSLINSSSSSISTQDSNDASPLYQMNRTIVFIVLISFWMMVLK